MHLTSLHGRQQADTSTRLDWSQAQPNSNTALPPAVFRPLPSLVRDLYLYGTLQNLKKLHPKAVGKSFEMVG